MSRLFTKFGKLYTNLANLGTVPPPKYMDEGRVILHSNGSIAINYDNTEVQNRIKAHAKLFNARQKIHR